MTKPIARIDDWRILGEIGYGGCLIGRISNHPRQEEFKASFQITSPLITIDINNHRAESRNTVYFLGKEYSTNARETKVNG